MTQRQLLSNRLKSDLTVTSPGRINMIGEHTDYNNGYVLPAAIDKTITLKLGKNDSEKSCKVYSMEYADMFEFDLDCIERTHTGWKNYVLGVLHEISQHTDKLKGFDCTIESHIPIGSGMSSSAALECGLASGLNELFNLGLSKWEIIKLSQKAEHDFVGTKCGIMDQFASVMGKMDHVMLLDCMTLGFDYIPMDLTPYRILLLNTNVTHNLASSEYNSRRAQCEKGLAILQDHFGRNITLRDATPSMLHQCKETMGRTIYDRCSYVIEENSRVLQAVKALKEKDIEQFGRLLYETHQGLSQKYEVSCPELDFLVDFSKERKEVLGARMMGGGFGGCTLNIIHEDAITNFTEEMGKAYESKFYRKLDYYQTLPSEGTVVLKHKTN